jgi:hypothetical protein
MLTGAPGLSADVGEAVAIKGWLRRIRRWRRQGGEVGRPNDDLDTKT